MRGWPEKPRRFSSRSATPPSIARRSAARRAQGGLRRERTASWRGCAYRRSAAVPANCRNRSGRRRRRPRASTNSTRSPPSPVMRYRARLPPSPWRLPFAITAQSSHGWRRAARQAPPATAAYRAVELRDLEFEAAAALLVRDKRELIQRPRHLVQVIADAIEFDERLQSAPRYRRKPAAVHARARRRFNRSRPLTR